MRDYKELISKVLEYQNSYEADKLLECFTDDIKFITIDDNSIFADGKSEIKNMIEETKVEDRYRWTLDNITTTEDKIITLETVTKADNDTDKYIFIYEMKDNLINKVWMTSQ